MKRFWLFAGNNFYPHGGMKDFRGSFDSIEEAQDSFQISQYKNFYGDEIEKGWAHIYNGACEEIVLYWWDSRGEWVEKEGY